jgi:hypothetical protein
MEFSNEKRLDYIRRLIGKIFKMLPIREGSEEAFKNYYKSIMFELEGAKDAIFSDSFFFVDLVAKINKLPELFFDEKNSANHRDFKKRIMECIDVVDKIREELINGQGNQK